MRVFSWFRKALFLSLLLAFGAGVFIPVAGAQEVERVIVVSIDGLRRDAVSPEATPVLTELMGQGASSPNARCVAPTKTIPNHVSMITGLHPAKHGFIKSRYPDRAYVRGSLFEQLRRAGKTSGLYVSKAKLHLLAKPAGVNRHMVFQPGSSERVVKQFLRDMGSAQTQWDFCLLHLIEPDAAGHQYGWMSGGYLQAVRKADRLLGQVWRTLERKGLRSGVLLIVTSDHGGEGSGHSGASTGVLSIPWVVVGPGVPKESQLQGSIGPLNVAPTVLEAFGYPIPRSMRGTPVQRQFDPNSKQGNAR